MNDMGGCILLHRQFVERDDFEVFVVTDRRDFTSDSIPHLLCGHPAWLQRLMRSRLALFAHDYAHLCGGLRIPAAIMAAAREFRPDVVMMGAETWLADIAARVARRLRVPLAGHFMDWPSFAALGHGWAKKRLSARFRWRYRQCDLAFGICPEMLEALGPHPNAHVFYPAGNRPAVAPSGKGLGRNAPFTVLFAGNLGQWYGLMLASLAAQLRSERDIRLRIAGGNASWGAAVEADLRRDGVFLGLLKGEDYQKVYHDCDALLLAMGFEPDGRLIESTSFKSKLADYLTSGRPLVVWGPEYCTAVRHARREDFAEVVTTENPAAVVAAFRKIARDPARAAQLVAHGQRFWAENLDAEKVMPRACEAIRSLVLPV